METPRSTPPSNQTVSSNAEESDTPLTKSCPRNLTKEDRSAMTDITNDSPIVNLMQTPTWSAGKEKGTPLSGKGESLLRGQVRSFLQRAEEDTFQVSNFSLEENRGPFFHLQNFVGSPMALLAPTPNNTPIVTTVFSTPFIIREQMNASQAFEDMISAGMKRDNLQEEHKRVTDQSLKLDFYGKTETSVDSADCSSGVSYQEIGKSSADDDGASSVWSIQVNPSSTCEEKEEEEKEDENKEDDFYNVKEEENGYERCIDELCEGLVKTNLEMVKKQGKFSGKHTRFVYNSDDEIESCEVLDGIKCGTKFEGKHTRFAYNSDDEIEEDDSAMGA